MAIDQNVCDAARMLDQERPIGPLEDSVLGALEQHDTLYEGWSDSRKELADLFAKVLSAWVRHGVVIDTHARKPPRCLIGVRVKGGTARGATKFRVVSRLSIEVSDSGDPENSYWTVRAEPISPRTGKPMSGRPSGAVTNHDYVTLGAQVYGGSDATSLQQARDAFIDMVADAEKLLHELAHQDQADEHAAQQFWQQNPAAGGGNSHE